MAQDARRAAKRVIPQYLARRMTRNLHTLIRDIQRRKARERRGLVVAEGLRLVGDALAGGAKVVAVLAADDVAATTAAPVLAAAGARGIETQVTARKEFDALADTETPSGVLAVVEWEPGRLADVAGMDVGLLRVLVLDGVQDPGNVGTMIRTAYGLGIWMTVVLDGTADPRSAKVIRASMGAVFRHPVVAGTFAEFDELRRILDLALWVASADGEPVDQLVQAATDDIALIIGSEGHGVRDAWRSLDHVRVAVPMRGGAESLNAGVAAGILLYELTRASR